MNIIEKQNHIEILISGNKTVLIDHKDKWVIKTFPYWYSNAKNYVVVHRKIQTDYGYVWQNIQLHRLILGLFWIQHRGIYVDHKNRNPLDNRRSNLRTCSMAQNNVNSLRRNKNGFRGVLKTKNKTNPYAAQVWCPKTKKTNTIGCFKTKEEAAFAYDKEAKKRWGEFAVLNFPDKL